MYAKFAARTPGNGNTAGGPLACGRSLVKGEGLWIATWARPPRLTCGATGVSLSSAPGRGKTVCRKRLRFRLLEGQMVFARCYPRIML